MQKHDDMDDQHLLTDISLRLTHSELRPVYAPATAFRQPPGEQGAKEDLALVSGRPNLGQSVMMRLLTPLGELDALGHPTYGSRLHELVGRQNTETTRNLVRLYILDSLQREPRIARVLQLAVSENPGSRDRIDVQLVVQPTDKSEPVTIGPFTLELG